MSRISRLLELLEVLQSAGTRTVPELAQSLGVDERTARRDIDALRELGIPVISTRGRHGGYRIGNGYRMPPLMLNDGEALAVLVALTRAAAETTARADTLTIASATAKIRRSLPRHLTEQAEGLLDTVVFAPGPAPGPPPAPIDPNVLLSVAAATRDRRPLALEYTNRTGGRSRRSLQPHDLLAYAGRWYLVGLDGPTQQVRLFRLDRIRAVRILGGTFPEPPPHDPVADLIRRLAGADYRYLVVLRVRATVETVREHFPASVAHLEPVDADWLRATIHAESLSWLPGVLLTLGSEVIVEQPDELRATLSEAATRLRDIAAGPI